MRTLLLSLALLAPFASAAAKDRVIDTHVHLWNGEASLAEYRAKLKAAGLSVERFGAAGPIVLLGNAKRLLGL